MAAGLETRPDDGALFHEHADTVGRRCSADLHGRRVVLVVNAEWYFLLHWLDVARGLRGAGADVTIMTADERGRVDRIVAAGFAHVVLPLRRRSMNPLHELRTLRAFVHAYRRIRPDVVHHVTIKPVVFGTLVARLLDVPVVMCTVPGLGYMFYGHGAAGRLRRAFATALYRLACRSPRVRVIFQNGSDRDVFLRHGIVRETHARVILGAGVDIDRFVVRPEADGPPVVLFASRLLWDKGLGEFVELARRLRAKGSVARFVVAGGPDTLNPATVSEATIKDWSREGVIEWWGDRDDMPSVLAQSHVVVLPARFREGLPTILSEAAACGRPVVTSALPGCTDVVVDGVTGLLVAPGDADGLEAAVAGLLRDPPTRARLGAAARQRAATLFSRDTIVKQTLSEYGKALAATDRP